MILKRLQLIASISLVALILLCVAWEGWLAPIRAGGSLLILKALPLLFPLFGILRGKRYTYQGMSLLILLYFTEGAVRAYSDHGLSGTLAGLEVILTVTFFFAAIYYAKLSAPTKLNPAEIKAAASH